MSPEERRLLAELFERTREAATHPRDREAEALIAELVRGQPAAPYLLAQAVLVQEQALKAADQRMQDMEAEIEHLDGLLRERESRAPQSRSGGGFLGSIFGGGEAEREPPRQPPRGAVPPSGGGVWGSGRTLNEGARGPAPGGMGPGGMGSGGMGMVPQQGGPWSGQRQQAAPAPQQGGGFLSGALTTAAGVAGGMLLANSIGGLFKGQGDPLGMGARAGEAPKPAGEAGGSITDGVPGYGRMTEAQQREQDRLQDEDQDQDMEQDEEMWDDEGGGDEGGYDDE